jgi:hypothetical protein
MERRNHTNLLGFIQYPPGERFRLNPFFGQCNVACNQFGEITDIVEIHLAPEINSSKSWASATQKHFELMKQSISKQELKKELDAAVSVSSINFPDE